VRTPEALARVAAPLAIGLVVLAQLAVVAPTNFGGYDEWLIVQLTSAGRVSIPYAERPLELVWNLPAPLLFPHRLEAFLWLHGVYLWLTGVLVWRLFARLAPGQGMWAFLAGSFAATWAPLDFLRLNAVETVAYSGVTFVTLAAASLLLEAWRRRSTPLLAAAAALALCAARTYESVLPLLFAAPALLWAAPVPREDRRARWRFVALWEAVVLLAGSLSVAGVLLPAEGSYQVSALSLDLHPARVLRRLIQQAAYHLGPAVKVSWPEMRTAHVIVTTVTFLLAAAAIAPRQRDPVSARAHARQALLGLALAVLGWTVFVLSPAIRSAARTQFLSAPGVGVLLAAVIALAAGVLPPPVRAAAAVILAAWIVAVGAARTGAMQREWDARSYWSVQSASLREITAAVPDVLPNTLVLVLDERGAWPATFTFRHALLFLYQGRAIGLVPGAHDFLYPARFAAGGISCEPWPVIREPWGAAPTFHRGSEIVALALAADGSVSVLESWPSALPAASGTGYAPRSRIVAAGAPLGLRRILDAGVR
jgi:hypothetical protein